MLGERIVNRGLAGMGEHPSPRQIMEAAVMGAMPVDEESRTSILLFLNFYIASLTDAALASARLMEATRWTVPFMADLIRTAQTLGQAAGDIDAEKEAMLLMTALSGIGLGVLAGLHTSEEAVDAVRYRLRPILPPPGAPRRGPRQA